jgi:hypothetical protein
MEAVLETHRAVAQADGHLGYGVIEMRLGEREIATYPTDGAIQVEIEIEEDPVFGQFRHASRSQGYASGP